MIRSFVRERYAHRDDVIAATLVTKSMKQFQLLDGFDALVLAAASEPWVRFTNHYSKDGWHIQERWFGHAALESILSTEDMPEVKQWFFAGEILFDKRGLLRTMREKMLTLQANERENMLFREFCMFLRHFTLSKTELENGDLLDAHSNILAAVHHWAKMSIIESGAWPELAVWKQVRTINAGIFKLYEELSSNTETLEQRVRLAHLACDFSVLSKLLACCRPLLRVLSSRSEPWSVSELEHVPEFAPVRGELHLVLKKLAQRSFIREVWVAGDPALDFLELKYTS